MRILYVPYKATHKTLTDQTLLDKLGQEEGGTEFYFKEYCFSSHLPGDTFHWHQCWCLPGVHTKKTTRR